ncbi:hypothetical protein GDO86_002776 [Hymenochirus boettgeri]|uniref:Protein Mis18-alpha n=1 Tax=Hymenochirus boettgeri TaxID=247094 RepID=A0A8T2K3N7_9PIPI|nr:hypothetical protein GDO86_002776 [Hymenochirus boettgeri]KAG8450251.1 hypothetical protein GDO86_002776 [Hymenochirus boettgeri]
MAAKLNSQSLGSASVRLADNEGNTGEATKAAEEELPVVFLCSKCKRPIGDSYSWMGSDIEDQTILLKAVSAYVSVEKVQIVSNIANDYGCTFETVSCSGCSSVMGKVYRCTPKHLDFKRDLISLNIDAVDSYVLGSAMKQAIPELEEPITLGVRAVLEEEIAKTKAVLNVLQSRVSTIESHVFPDKDFNGTVDVDLTDMTDKSINLKKI